MDVVVALSDNIQNGLNAYAYCLNDPVNYCDIQGFFPSKGHQSGHGFDEFRGLSVDELGDLYKLLRKSRNKEDRATAQKVQTELKLRQMRNKTKREGYGHSKMVDYLRTLPRIFVYPSAEGNLPNILGSPSSLFLPNSTFLPLDVSIDGLIVDSFNDFDFNININNAAGPITDIGIGAIILILILLLIPGPQPI